MSNEHKPTAADVVARMDAIDVDDPGAAHGKADDLLLLSVPPEVAAAYARLMDRCEWWESA